MNWLKGNGYSVLVLWRCYSRNKIRCNLWYQLSSVNKKQVVIPLIRGFSHATFFYWQRIWPGSILWLRGPSSVRVTQQSPGASEPITMEWKYHTILQLTWIPQWTIDLCRSTWFSNFQQPQLSITAEGKRQNFVTVIVPRKEYDTQGAINDQTIPWHRTSFLVYRSLCCVCAVAFMWKQIYGC